MKNKALSIFTLLLTGTLLFAGCGQSNTAATSDKQVTSEVAASTDTDASTETDAGNATTDDSQTLFSSMETTDLDGNAVDSSIFSENKVTLVNVWNVGCTPCVNEIPELDKINSEYQGKGAAVYGLSCDFGNGIPDDELAQIKDIMTNANASYTQLRMDGTLKTSNTLLNLMAFPTTYVVDSEGNILDTIEGSNDYDGWKEVIDSYLAQAE